MGTEKVKIQWEKHKTVIIAVLATVLALGFIGSIIGAVFSGGEFIEEVEIKEAKGVIMLDSASYSTGYLEGDTFDFDVQNSRVMLMAKDPAIDNIVNIPDLPKSEYGFTVNDEGEIIDDASSIVMNKDIKTVEVVSKKYPNIKTPIAVDVIGSLDTEKLVNTLTLEGETANLYKDGELLTQAQKESMPASDKPYLSDKGTAPEADRGFSGGVVLRNFQSDNMKIEFVIVCSENTQVTLEVLVCKRKAAGSFDSFFVTKLNGKIVEDIASQVVPARASGEPDYYQPYTLEPVTVTLRRGINTLTFESGSAAGTGSPVNFDAIKLTSAKANIGTIEAVKD